MDQRPLQSLTVRSAFDKALDPRECAFGKWYYAYIESDEFKSEAPEMARLIRALDEPHRHLHEGGARVVGKLSSMTGNILVSAESVANAADQIASGNQELAKRTQEQAATIEETAATIEQMSATVKQTAENAGKANNMAQDTASMAQNGGRMVEETVASMSEVS